MLKLRVCFLKLPPKNIYGVIVFFQGSAGNKYYSISIFECCYFGMTVFVISFLVYLVTLYVILFSFLFFVVVLKL